VIVNRHERLGVSQLESRTIAHFTRRPYHCTLHSKAVSLRTSLVEISATHCSVAVPCTPQLGIERSRKAADSAVHDIIDIQDDGSTVLSEFSSVVTDTQQYMSPNEASATNQEVLYIQ